jgi:hypothetical protein
MLASASPSRLLTAAFLILLLCLAAYIRVAGADLYYFSPDELNHIELAQGKTAGEVLRFSLFETHPPLGHLLRHYWMQISDAPWFIRSLSLSFGLALIPVYYLIGLRLGGRWAGMCSAALIAFSHACIIQSYVIRNYIIFLFFLSLAFYAYLRWRQERTTPWLISYTILGCLSDLTHFSGIFAIFCIASAECCLMLRPGYAARRIMVRWAAANLCVAGVTLAAIYFWQPLLSQSKAQMMDAMHPLFSQQNPLYPLLVVDYLFIYRASAIHAICLFTVVAGGLYIAASRLPGAGFYCALACFSLALGWALAASGIYPAGGNRYSLWLLPLMLPPAGCALALLCGRLRPLAPEWGIAALLLLCGWASYSPVTRFGDLYEYMITRRDLSDYTHYLRALDASHLIIAGRSDAFLISYPPAENFYHFYAVPGIGSNLTVMQNYAQAKLMFKPYAYNYTPDDLVTFVADAEAEGKLRGISSLVFTSTRWSRGTTIGLMLCPALNKTVVTFPPSPDFQALSREAVDRIPAIALIVSRQDFLHELAAPGGKARACLGRPAD